MTSDATATATPHTERGDGVYVEETTKHFVGENPYILDHCRRSLQRYLRPSERLRQVQASAALKLTKNPTEYLNVFGAAYRYLRHLRVRRRIKATTTRAIGCRTLAQPGRHRRRIKATTTRAIGWLAEQELPTSELRDRADRERRETFLRWLQDPDRVIYDDALARTWKTFLERKETLHDARGRIAQFFFGERQKNYEDARTNLFSAVGMCPSSPKTGASRRCSPIFRGHACRSPLPLYRGSQRLASAPCRGRRAPTRNSTRP